MTVFNAGDRVHVHLDYDGVISYPEDHGDVWVKPDGHTGARKVSAESVTPLDPQGWPPRRCDIWMSGDGKEYYARQQYSTAGGMGLQIIMIPENDSPSVPVTLFRGFNPRLIRRRSGCDEVRS